ncbi:hypothetical protein EJ02DRAFT_180962 [Clathrospora elynae]|uniref:SET domain-containing protein n=1 Tax=Clathrospora elynae TaxID=706981 RepID=A0A6A5SR25_9PLEO|nr:hypothetical protein EJ02DRAFT_180962 [Clathrospora elynae]
MDKNNVLRDSLTRELGALQQSTLIEPYSIVHRLKLARAYKNLGYPDLAAGDAYKALILVDEVVDEGEYYDQALEAARTDFISERMATLSVKTDEDAASTEDEEIVTWAQISWSKSAYDLLIGCLLDCGCLRSAYDYVIRAKKAFSGDTVFENHDISLSRLLRSHFEANGENFDDTDIDEYPDKGLVRREQYPWNHHEPDRFSDECLDFLNEELASIAPRLKVKVAELPVLSSSSITKDTSSEIQYAKQLGLFATEDIPPGEQVLEEKSLLTAVARLHESYCDACSIPLATSEEVGNTIIACEECDVVFFCSIDCHDLAQDSYHSSLCGVSVEQGNVPLREAADYLYTLLLFRTLALAETQDLHPLELKEVRYIWGDYHALDLDTIWKADSSGRLVDAFGGVSRTLPFSFKNNILMPLHVLEKMDVNIFTQSHRYDTWIFNTLYAKFRGTASARLGLDGKPEISAVHPMWCLANHSCDPSVSWDWRGTMRLWTREKLVDWEGRDSSKGPGLKIGEEVFSHYCDVRLPVKERREWAVGALGGDCMCDRCVWEEAEEQKHDIAQ